MKRRRRSLYITVSRIVVNYGVVHIALKHEAIVVGFFWCMRLCTTLTLWRVDAADAPKDTS